jgi:hypothetical protein
MVADFLMNPQVFAASLPWIVERFKADFLSIRGSAVRTTERSTKVSLSSDKAVALGRKKQL